MSVMEGAVSPPGEHVMPALLLRARSEFIEMPGMRLTVAQAARLWGVDTVTSAHLLDALLRLGFLWKARDGGYLRRTRT